MGLYAKQTNIGREAGTRNDEEKGQEVPSACPDDWGMDMTGAVRICRKLAGVFVLSILAGCGEPMQFENASSKHTLAQDQAACNQEVSQQTTGVAYAQETMGRVDPMQTCMEHKGWRRMDRTVTPSTATNP